MDTRYYLFTILVQYHQKVVMGFFEKLKNGLNKTKTSFDEKMNNVFSNFRKVDEELNLNRKVLVVTDCGVPKEYAQFVAGKSKEAVIGLIKSGEDYKSLESWQNLLKLMLDNNFTRGDCVVAVGGGIVGDLAGFVAASYMRGIDFYNIPTTVLSQVDSSVGGKTGVNFNGVKNIVVRIEKVLIDGLLFYYWVHKE